MLIFTTIHLITSEYCVKKGIKKPGNLTAEWMVAAFDALAALHYLHYSAPWGARSRKSASTSRPGQHNSSTVQCSLGKHVNCNHKLQTPLLYNIILPEVNTKEVVENAEEGMKAQTAQ